MGNYALSCGFISSCCMWVYPFVQSLCPNEDGIAGEMLCFSCYTVFRRVDGGGMCYNDGYVS